MTLAISVVFSTLNGAARLPDVLEGLLNAEKTANNFEIIAVDNASTDDTAKVLSSYQNRLPLTVLSEPVPGKNVALNRAIDIAQGELIVFTDDDVYLPANILSGYEQLAQRELNFGIFGGHIAPRWSSAPDPRILDEIPLTTAYALTERDREAGLIVANRLYGPNMAMRRQVFDSGLRFDESIGPNGGRYIMGDESDMLIRAEAAGFKAYFDPSIEVEHKIRPEQLKIDWLAGRASLAGMSMVHNQIRRHGGHLPETPLFCGVPRWALSKLIAAQGSLFAQRIGLGSKGLFSTTWRRGFHVGYISEYRLQAGVLRKGKFDEA